MISGKMQIYAHLYFDSEPSHFKHFRIKFCLQNTILNLTNKVLVQHCQKIQLILKSVILYIYAHLFCLPIFSIASLATFVQFFTFWNRIFFSECFDNVDFFSSFGGVKGDFLVNYTSLRILCKTVSKDLLNIIGWKTILKTLLKAFKQSFRGLF